MPPRATLPREGAGRRAASEGGEQTRISGKKRDMIRRLWYADGLSPRQIAARTGISRRATESFCKKLAAELLKSMPEDMGFEARFGRAWARRLEAIGEAITVYEDEAEALEERRTIAASEGNWPLYGQMSSLILANRREANSLRHEYAETYAMPPPRELLMAEVRRVAASLPAMEAPA